MKTTLVGVLLVAAAGYGVYEWQGRGGDTPALVEHDTRLLRNRLWVDHIPRSETDRMQVFVVVTQQGRRPAMGLFEQVSMWEGHFEAFRYELHDEELRAVFPQSGDRETLTVKPRACSEAGMDYCLEVDGSSRGVKRYYSKKGWEIRSLEEATALGTRLADHSSAHK